MGEILFSAVVNLSCKSKENWIERGKQKNIHTEKFKIEGERVFSLSFSDSDWRKKISNRPSENWEMFMSFAMYAHNICYVYM